MVGAIEITYINEGGNQCIATLTDPDRVISTWYSSKKNLLGKYEKHEVTVFSSFMKKLNRNCKITSLVQSLGKEG